jgi:carbamoyltransferase
MTLILGINAYHGDSSACLIRDGKLIAAAEEERFRRIKHWAGFPSEAIRYCLDEAVVRLGEVEHIAINQDSKANLWEKIGFVLSNRPDLGMVMDRIKNKRERANVREVLRTELNVSFNGNVHEIEHHLAHLSSAFHVSPFEDALVVSIDGFGDFASTAWGMGHGSEISVDERVYFPHSLGIFYQAMTQWLGFPNYGDEYKVMGLAPYGKPNQLNKMRDIVHLQSNGSFKLNLDYFRHHNEKVEYEWDEGIPKVDTLFSEALIELLGPVRQKVEKLTQFHKDIAHSVQTMYEESFFHLLNKLYQKYNTDKLCLAGGCAMNSVANGKIYCKTPFKKVYIQSAAGDAGGAIGSAYSVWHKLGGKRDFIMDHAFWGPCFDNSYFKNLLDSHLEVIREQQCKVVRFNDENVLCEHTVSAIAEGKVVGWFQGRMEWGPRALGNRSILCDPRRDNMKEILNKKIKKRESFRPFAPSVLRESVNEWFEQDDDVPFMMQVYPIREEKRALIPAVTHIDGSGRLQTVCMQTNPLYHKLIRIFLNQTGVPMVLNTSFNENEPVVCLPEEALACFLRTKMDVLVLGNWFIIRESEV